MRPEHVLGLDPTPGDSVASAGVAGVLRSVVLALAQSRQRLEHAVGPTTVWHAYGGSSVGQALVPLTSRLRTLEDAVVDFSQAWARWCDGLAERQARTAELTEAVATVQGHEDAADVARRREALLAEARQLADRHTRAESELETAAEALVEALAVSAGEQGDVVTDLASAIGALTAGVEQWMAQAASWLGQTVGSLEDAAELTVSMSTLLGVGDGRVYERALQVAAVAPGAHRLLPALGSPWTDTAGDLPVASFEEAADASIADRLRAPGPSDDAPPQGQP